MNYANRVNNVNGEKFMLLNPQSPLKLPEVFSAQAFDGYHNHVDFISGMLGMQNSLMGWENLIVGVRFAMYAFIVMPDHVHGIISITHQPRLYMVRPYRRPPPGMPRLLYQGTTAFPCTISKNTQTNPPYM